MGRRKKTTEEHRAEIIKLKLKLELVGEYLGADIETDYKCLIHKQIIPAKPGDILQRRKLKCCVKGNGQIQKEKAAAEYDKKLKKINKLERIDNYIDAATPIRHRCIEHDEIHPIRPNGALRGQGLKCCGIAKQKETARKRLEKAKTEYDTKLKESGSPLIRIGEYVKAIVKIKHICIKHAHIDEISPNNALRGYGMSCCGKASQLETARKRFEKAARTFDDKLKEKNPTKVRVGEYKGNDQKTKFRCLIHNEVHPARPGHMLSGQGIYCCRVAKAREIGKVTGPLNGTKIDSVWRVLCDMQEKSGKCWLYLHESPCPPYNKFGISNEPKVRSRRGGYGAQLIEPRFYPDRDDAVLIEQAFKYGYGADIPEELTDWKGNTELTNIQADEFINTIEELEKSLLEMGRWDFAEEYCDPRELERAIQEINNR